MKNGGKEREGRGACDRPRKEQWGEKWMCCE